MHCTTLSDVRRHKQVYGRHLLAGELLGRGKGKNQSKKRCIIAE